MIQTSSRPLTEEDLARIDPERGSSPVAPWWARLMFAGFSLLIIGAAIGAGLALLSLRVASASWLSTILGLGAVACGAFALAMVYVTYHVAFPRSPSGGRLVRINRNTRVEVTRIDVARAFVFESEDETPALLVRSACGRWASARGAELLDAIRSQDGPEAIGVHLTLETVGGCLVRSASLGQPVVLELLDEAVDTVEDVVFYEPGQSPLERV